jgi:hypothetical protein
MPRDKPLVEDLFRPPTETEKSLNGETLVDYLAGTQSGAPSPEEMERLWRETETK